LRRIVIKIGNEATVKTWEKAFEFILALSSERKITFGRGEFATPHGQGVWQAVDIEGEDFA